MAIKVATRNSEKADVFYEATDVHAGTPFADGSISIIGEGGRTIAHYAPGAWTSWTEVNDDRRFVLVGNMSDVQLEARYETQTRNLERVAAELGEIRKQLAKVRAAAA